MHHLAINYFVIKQMFSFKARRGILIHVTQFESGVKASSRIQGRQQEGINGRRGSNLLPFDWEENTLVMIQLSLKKDWCLLMLKFKSGQTVFYTFLI